MFLPRDSARGDDELVGYVLGTLPEHAADRLDEASIVDDDVALRLRIVENDLVDAYVRNTLDRRTRERFESHYMSSPRRREHVRRAASFLRAIDREAARADDDARGRPAGAPAVHGQANAGAVARGRAALTSRRVWWLAVAAAVLLTAGTALLLDAMRAGRVSSALPAGEVASAGRRPSASAAQGNAVPGAKPAAVENGDARGERAPAAAASAEAQPAATQARRRPQRPGPAMLALVLMPQTRAISAVPTLVVAHDTRAVSFDLRLEANDFDRYRIDLRDAGTRQQLWQSGWIAAKTPTEAPTVSVVVPANVLKPQHYSLDLTGRDAAGRAVIVGSYPVRVAAGE